MINIFYFRHLNEIGGIETFFWYLARKYSEWDITIFYKAGDDKQIARLKQYCDVRRWKGERVSCKNAFFNFNLEMLDYVDAENYYQVAHGDYKSMGIKPNTDPRLKYIGISENTCRTYKEVTGYDIELCYNPIIKPKARKALNLISATRLTKEKGADRLKKLAETLDFHNVPYTWQIFTDARPKEWSENVVFRKTKIDILPHIASADYLVQLSDNEGYCYSVVEALCLGTPVIVTPCPVYEELGLNGNNSITLPFDMSEIPVAEIIKGKRKFKYEPPEDRWGELLAEGKSTYDPDAPTAVKITKTYYDMVLQRMVKEGETIYVTPERAQTLVGKVAKEAK